jgi:hypothetical protein
MTLEEGLVDRHVFDPDHPLPDFQLLDAIHQEKRVAMGQDRLDFGAVQAQSLAMTLAHFAPLVSNSFITRSVRSSEGWL